MMTVVPLISRNSRWMRSKLVTVLHCHPRQPVPRRGTWPGSSVTITSLATPSATRLAMICSTLWPSGALTHALATGHGDGVVVEHLVGDVDPGGNALANGQQAAVEVGAVAQVGKHMGVGGERLLPDPGHALAAHLAEGAGGAVHPDRHEMAANAGQRAGTLGHPGAGVVRAAAAKPGRALDRCRF